MFLFYKHIECIVHRDFGKNLHEEEEEVEEHFLKYFVGPPRTLSPRLFLKKSSFTLLGYQELVNPNFISILFVCLFFLPQNLFLS